MRGRKGSVVHRGLNKQCRIRHSSNSPPWAGCSRSSRAGCGGIGKHCSVRRAGELHVTVVVFVSLLCGKMSIQYVDYRSKVQNKSHFLCFETNIIMLTKADGKNTVKSVIL